MKKVLILGANGFVGSLLAEKLSKEYKVIAIDWFIWKNVIPVSKNIEIINADIRTIEKLPEVDYVIDLASISNDPAGELNPELTLNINYFSRLRMFYKLIDNVEKYIVLSTCSVYGQQAKISDTKTKPNPLTTYAKSAFLLEKDILNSGKKGYEILRLGTIFGTSPRTRLDTVINIWINNFARNKKVEVFGNSYRPFLYIENLVSHIEDLLKVKPTNKITNIVDKNFNTLDLLNTLKELLDKESIETNINIDNIDKRDYEVAPSQSYVPKYSFEEAVMETYKNILQTDKDISITLNFYKDLNTSINI
tara:strand:- start:36763 stop:37683 length:921 start_codon:yes stop_codon:yes gene_type:complete